MKKSKDKAPGPQPVELSEQELGDVAGGAGDSGGGIYNTGSLTLTNSTISGNRSTSGDGIDDIVVGAGPGGGPHVR